MRTACLFSHSFHAHEQNQKRVVPCTARIYVCTAHRIASKEGWCLTFVCVRARVCVFVCLCECVCVGGGGWDLGIGDRDVDVDVQFPLVYVYVCVCGGGAHVSVELMSAALLRGACTRAADGVAAAHSGAGG